MKILFLTYSSVGQSNYLRASSLAEAVAAAGHDVTLVAGTKRPSPRTQAVRRAVGHGELRRLSVRSRGSSRFRNSGLSVSEAWRRRAALARAKFDVVHGFGHRPTVSWVGPALARARGVPYVADWCDLFGDGGIASERALPARATLGILDGWWERRVYGRADAVTVISRALEKRTRQLNGDIRVVRVGPGALPAATADAASAARRRLGIPAQAPVVVQVSQNHHDLGLLRESLIEIARRRTDVHFLLVGPAYPCIEEAASRADLQERMHFTGMVPHREVAALLAAASLALLPYPSSIKNECRFPCSFSEYAGAGLPIVTQPTGDLSHLGKEPAAFLVPAAAESMADAVDRILRDPETASRMGDRARRLARDELSWSIGARRLLELYERLTAEHVPHAGAAATP